MVTIHTTISDYNLCVNEFFITLNKYVFVYFQV